AVSEVVGIHDGADVALFYGSLECREIDLAHGALVDEGVDVVAVIFLVVTPEVLDGGANALGLETFDVSDSSARSQKRILAEVLEVSACHGSAIDVDAGAEQDVDASSASVVSKDIAEFAHQLEIPGCGQSDSAYRAGGTVV